MGAALADLLSFTVLAHSKAFVVLEMGGGGGWHMELLCCVFGISVAFGCV